MPSEPATSSPAPAALVGDEPGHDHQQGSLRSTMRRSGVWIVWTLDYHHAASAGGHIQRVSSGRALTTRSARDAIESWRRVFMRRHGLLW